MTQQPDPRHNTLLETAIDLQREGRLEEAAALFEQILAEDPHHLDALHLMGVLAYQNGEDDRALHLMEQALEIDPTHAVIHNSRGLVLHRMERHDEAIASYQAALKLEPLSAQAHNNLGNVLKDVERYAEAITHYQTAIEVDPRHLAAWFNMGNACWSLGRLAEAGQCFEKSLELMPRLFEAMRCRAIVAIEMGQPATAEPLLRELAEARGEDAEIHTLLGGCLLGLGSTEEAIDSFDRAIELDENQLQPWFGLGCARTELGEFAAAIGDFSRGLAVDPQHAESHHNLARCLFELGRLDEALIQFRAALRPAVAELPLRSIAMFVPRAPGADDVAIREARKAWWHRRGDLRPVDWDRDITVSRRPLRVGYVSADFSEQQLLAPAWAAIRHHDPAAVEVHLFSDREGDRIPEENYEPAHVRIHETGGCTGREVAEMIASCGIDIVVDLNGFAYPHRLEILAHRPAPLVIAWLNNDGPTGMGGVDYVIADEYLIPADEAARFSERVLYVEGCSLPFEVRSPAPNVVAPPCVNSTEFVLGCLAPQSLITPKSIAVWASILQECPSARLLLKNATLQLRSNRAFIREMFQSHGIGGDRLQLSGPSDRFRQLQTYSEIDLALDPIPAHALPVAREALWQGVPVLTWYGTRWAERPTASLMRSAGLDEFVADDLSDYLTTAVRWITDPQSPARLDQYRRAMRKRLIGTRAGDAPAFARSLEAAYRRAWTSRCEQE